MTKIFIQNGSWPHPLSPERTQCLLTYKLQSEHAEGALQFANNVLVSDLQNRVLLPEYQYGHSNFYGLAQTRLLKYDTVKLERRFFIPVP